MTTMEEEVRTYYKYKSNLKFMLATYGTWPHYEKFSENVRKVINAYGLSLHAAFSCTTLAFLISVCRDVKTFSALGGGMIGTILNLIKVST